MDDIIIKDAFIKDTVSFITLSNLGYVDLTRNCYKTLENVGCIHSLKCYCIDEESEKILKETHSIANVFSVPNLKFGFKHMPKFRDENWNKVVINKFNIIFDNLLTSEYVLFTDGDIVYEKNGFVEFCLDKIQKDGADILIQNDGDHDSSRNNLCTGFMFIKSNETTRNFFDPSKINIQTFRCDQIHINHNKHKLHLSVLPLHLFPNGGYYKSHQSSIDEPFLIHFNWCGGDQKIRWMKNCQKYYV